MTVVLILLAITVFLLSGSIYLLIKRNPFLSKKEKEFIIFVIDIFSEYGDELGIQTKEQHQKLVDELEKIKKKIGKHDKTMGVVFDNMNAVVRLAYSRCKCLEILMKRDGMTEEEALEYFDFNVEGAYMGEKTPVWVDDTYTC